MQPVSKAAARVLDFLTRDLANPCGEGVSSRRLGKEGDTYMPVSVQRVGETTYSVGHYVKQNGDLCPDPAMTFKRRDDGSWLALSIQQLFDGCREHYGIILDGKEEPVRIAPRRAADIRKFTSLWMRNIKAQQGIKLARQPRGPKRITVASVVTKDDILEASVLGTAAFSEGRKAIPALDRGLMGLIGRIPAGAPMGSSIPLLEAWSRAWHAANLAALVLVQAPDLEEDSDDSRDAQQEDAYDMRRDQERNGD